MACVVRSSGVRHASPNRAYFALVAEVRAAIAFCRRSSGVGSVISGARARATFLQASRGYTYVQISAVGLRPTALSQGAEEIPILNLFSIPLPVGRVVRWLSRAPRATLETGLCALFGSVLAISAAGCGREATESDCQLIMDRVVELELRSQNVTDPAEIRRKRNETLGLAADGSRKAWLEGCIGRRVTNRALDCVRAAKTADEITNQCLR